jgi:hypothetical protein
MLVRYEKIEAGHALDVLTASEMYLADKDAVYEDPGTYFMVADNCENGIAIKGTPAELRDWLSRMQRVLDAKVGVPA